MLKDLAWDSTVSILMLNDFFLFLVSKSAGYIVIRLGFLCLSKVYSLIPFFEKSPQEFQKRFFTTPLTKIEKKLEREKEKSQYTLNLFDVGYNSSSSEKISTLALGFAAIAKSLWGSASLVGQYKSAWYYVLAAELRKKELTSKDDNIANWFHFAAHTFRSLGEYQLAQIYYKESSQFAANMEFATRSLCRARGVILLMGDPYLEKETLTQIEALVSQKSTLS